MIAERASDLIRFGDWQTVEEQELEEEQVSGSYYELDGVEYSLSANETNSIDL